VRSPDRIRFPAREELLQGKFADRLQHAEAGLALQPALRHQQALLDERGDEVQDGVGSRTERPTFDFRLPTASASSSVQPSTNTASWRKKRCSSGERRS
jgi:hypothetical protein